MLLTTLNKIRAHNPCAGGWGTLLAYLGKTKADDEEISILTIIDSNGIDDAMWCLRAVEGKDKEIRLFAVWCARQVQHLMTDQRSLDALDVAERYANGEATEDELAAARDAAACAAEATRSAASWAVGAATGAAAEDAAEATKSSVWAAEAAWEATRADARSATGAAARSAVWEADVWDAAWAVARAKQEAELRRICEEIEG